MDKVDKSSLPRKLKSFVFGRPLDPSSRRVYESITLAAFFAWIGLGSDGLSSASYGPEEAYLALGTHTHLAILIAIASAVTVLIISASYAQIITLFPSGGGGYLVASKLVSPAAGMVSGCALIIDYVLTIAISLASASDALFSFLPADWQDNKLTFAACTVMILTLMNMRGIRESIAPLVPIFLIFIVTHVFAIMYALITHVLDFPRVAEETALEIGKTHSELGLWGMAFLLLRSFSMGAGTYTGIEAVSNGLSILREPRARTGRRTMLYMAASLAFTVFGLTLAYLLYNVGYQPGKTLNAVLFESISATWPASLGSSFVWVTLASEAFILFAAAQAGFLGGPRVLANMALDKWFPTRFSLLSDRLVTQNGIFLMGAASLMTMLLTGGSVKYLVVLYSITVFITFVLSQLGMVRHWWKNRTILSDWKGKLAINGASLALCSFILVAMTILKFTGGGWITIIITGGLISLCLAVRRHYDSVGQVLKRMDNLVAIAKSGENAALPRWMQGKADASPSLDPKARTAVLLVNGFNGVGLHSLLGIVRLFGGAFRNFIFMEVGIIDAGSFKGVEEVRHLEDHVRGELDQYVDFARRNGYYAEGIQTVSHDVVEGSDRLAPLILERFPQAVFFMGQLVFPEETYFSRLFHNNTVFAVQRNLYHKGVPFIILPIRIKPKLR